MKSFSKTYLAVSVFYFTLTCILTYPLILNLNSGIYGFKGDNMLYIHDIWAWGDGKGLDFGEIKPSQITTQPLLDYTAVIISKVTSPLTAYNLLIILSFVLSGLFTYLFIYKLTKSVPSALIAGSIFTFSSYHLRQAQVHLEISQIWVIPFYSYFFYNFITLPNKANTIKAGLSLGASTLIVNYYGFFLGLITGLSLLCEITKKVIKKQKKVVSYLLLVIGMFFITSMVVVIPNINSIKLLMEKGGIKELSWKAQGRNEEDYIKHSAKPWFYLLPDIDNPIFGKVSRNTLLFISKFKPFYLTRSYTSNESTLYIGLVTTIFAIYGAVKVKKVRIIIPLIIALFLFSLPPYLTKSETKIPLFSYPLYKLFPIFRVYSRWGIIILFTTLIPASFGIKKILNKLNSKKFKPYRVVLITLIILLSIGEHYSKVKFTNLLDPVPQHYEIVKNHRARMLTEGPKLEDFTTIFYQTYHEKPVWFTRITSQIEIDKNDLASNLNKVDKTPLFLFNSNYEDVFFKHKNNERGIDLHEINFLKTNPSISNLESLRKTPTDLNERKKWILKNIDIITSISGLKKIYTDGEVFLFEK